jgi:hypothetical protein
MIITFIVKADLIAPCAADSSQRHQRPESRLICGTAYKKLETGNTLTFQNKLLSQHLLSQILD